MISEEKPSLPKLTAPAEMDEGLKSLLGSASFSEEELRSDERLMSIVETQFLKEISAE